MKIPAQKGFYVVGEGNDGTGKSTQIDLLAEYLKKEYDLEVYVKHEPDGSPIAKEIRDVIKNGELERYPVTNLLLFTACRHETWYRETLPVLERGGIVLSARSSISTEIYQGIAEGLGVDYVRQVTQAFMDDRYMNPDLTVVFQLDDAIRRKLIKNRGKLEKPDTFESKGRGFQTKLNEGYAEIAKERGYPVIDAGRTIEQVQEEFRKLVIQGIISKGLA